jgi:hypothetical protein
MNRDFRIGLLAALLLSAAAPGLQAQTSSAAPPSEAAKRTLKYSREDEDWRWLAQGTKSPDDWDRFKYIPLAGDASLGLGADLRAYLESFRHEAFGTGLPSNDYLQTRALLHGDLRFNDRFRLFTQFEYADVPGRDGGPRKTIDRNDFDLNQLFAEANFGDEQLRIGRQELRFGNMRMVATRDGPLNARMPLDGARLIVRKPWGRLDAFLLQIVAVAPGAFDDHAKGQPWVWGGYYTAPQKAADQPALELYAIGYDARRNVYQEGIGIERRRTLGARITLNRNGWDHDVEANYAFGRFRSGNIRAWSANWEGGYTFRDVKWKPRLGWLGSVNSGDQKAGDGNLETYRPFVAKNPWAQMVPFGYPNIEGLQLNAGVQPIPALKLALRHFFLRRQSAGDGTYTGSFSLQRAATPGMARDLAGISSFYGEWDVNRHLRLSAAYDHVDAGGFILQGPGKRDTDYLALIALYRF